MPGPIKPSEVVNKKALLISETVFEVFNELIAQNWTGSEAIVKQDEAAALISHRMGIKRGDVFDRHLLDVEEFYRKAGWDVVYDKPGYNESYSAFFRFCKK